MDAKLALFAFAVALFPGNALANYDDCPPFVEPLITITPVFAEPSLDRNIRAVDLKDGVLSEEPNKRLAAYGNAVAEERVRIGGLTRFGNVVFSQGGDFKFTTLPSGTVCAQAQNFDLSIETATVVIYIASEFPESSCSYNVLLEHELNHVAVARTLFERSLIDLKYQMQLFFRQFGVVRGPSIESANEYISRAIKEYLEPYAANLAAELEVSGSLVDTPEEYRRVSESCGGETRRIFDNASHH